MTGAEAVQHEASIRRRGFVRAPTAEGMGTCTKGAAGRFRRSGSETDTATGRTTRRFDSARALLAGVPPWMQHPIAIAATIAFGIVFFVIFRTGRFLTSGDVAPMLVDGLQHEIGWQWSHLSSGAGGPTYEIDRTAEVLFARLGQLLGGTEVLGQRLLHSCIWASAAAGGAALGARFSSRRWVAVGVGLSAAFNPFTLIALPNPLPILAIGLVGTITALACAATECRRHPILLALLAFPLSYIALNPPLLAVVVVSTITQVVLAPLLTGSGRRGAGRVVGLLARAAIPGVLLSLWWAVPTVIAIRSADPTSLGAVINLDSWSWTHHRSSLPNVASLYGQWSWPRSEYYGRALVLEQRPWQFLRWMLPFAVVVAPFAAHTRRRRVATAVVVVLYAAAVVVGKGLHEPLIGLNRLLYERVPAFWLLREPAAKLGVIQVVVATVSLAVTVDGLLDRLRRGRSLRGRIGRALGVMVIAVPLVGVWPLWTAAVVKPPTVHGQGDRASVPKVWRDVAGFVNASPKPGKVLVLPVNDYYQVPTTWGYYGADSLLRRLMIRPVLLSDPQQYVGDTDAVGVLMRSAERAFTVNDGKGAVPLLRALGVSHVVVRKDIDFGSLARGTTMQRPETVLAGVRRVPELVPVLSESVAEVFEVEGPSSEVEVLRGLVSTGAVPATAIAPLRAALPDGLGLGEVVTVPEVAAGHSVIQHGGTSLDPRDLGDLGRLIASRYFSASPVIRVGVEGDVATFDPLVQWRVAGDEPQAFRRQIRVPNMVGFEHNGRLYDQVSDDAIVRFDAAASIVPLVRDGVGPVVGPRSEVRDCNDHSQATAAQLGFRATDLLTRSGPVVELRARRHSACIVYRIAGLVPNSNVHVALRATSVAGRVPPRFCLWLDATSACAAVAPFVAAGNRDYASSTTWTVPAGVTTAQLYLYADTDKGNGERTTVNVYREPILERAAWSAPITVGSAAPSNQPISAAASRPEITAIVDDERPQLSKPGELGDCDRYDDRTPAEAGLRSTLLPGGVRLEAKAHAACVSLALRGLKAGLSYAVTMAHRTTSGAKARFCVYDERAERCLASGRIDESNATWQSGQFPFDIPAGLSGEEPKVSLFLYADGVPGPGTVTEFAALGVAPYADEYLTLLSIDQDSSAVPTSSYRRLDPTKLRVRLRDAEGPFVLAFSDSYSTGWALDGLPAGTKVEHLRLDGYRNGWAIAMPDGAPNDVELTIRYGPARPGRIALKASAVSLLVLALALSVVRLRRRPLRSMNSAMEGAGPVVNSGGS